jgi:hypothetical protein
MRPIAAIASIMLGFAGLAAQPVSAEDADDCASFSTLSLRLDQNATDGDTELVLIAKGQDIGLKSLVIFAPNRRLVGAFNGDRRGVGIREFQLESAEATDLPRLLAAFPQGSYSFLAKNVNGQCLRGTAELSHAIAPATALLTPAEQQVVPVSQLLLSWAGVSDAERYIVQLNNKSAGTALTLEAPPSTTSLAVPAQFLQPDAEYQFLVGVRTATGNITFVERTFFTVR